MTVVTTYFGNCLTELDRVADGSVNLICTDLPYGTTNCAWDSVIPINALWEQFRRVLAPAGSVVLFGNQPFTSFLIMSNLPWYKQTLVWNKNKCGSPGLAKFRPMQVHEDIVIFSPTKTCYNPIMEKGTPYSRSARQSTSKNNHKYGFSSNTDVINTGTRYPKSIINISRDFSAKQQVHPTQKPVSLLSWLILTYSNENDTILDATMGSGTCGVASVTNHRNFIGIENNQEYYNIAVDRVNHALLNIRGQQQ